MFIPIQSSLLELGLILDKEDLPEAMAGPTPFKFERADTAASISFLLSMALNAFFVSCITTLGVFIWIRSFNLGRNFPR